jgi:hypothetical protein
MNFKLWSLLFVLFLIVSLPGRTFAQESQPELQLILRRNFGYGGFGEIQGSFTLRVIEPPAGLKQVHFYVDDEQITIAAAEPFEAKFHTGDFPDGQHSIYATGILSDGRQLGSNRIIKVFLSSEDAWSKTEGVLLPILLLIGLVTVLGIGIQVLVNRKKDFVLGKYGPAGGAVCPRCEFPFPRSVLAPNLLIGKLVHCPHCGKVSIQPQASQVQLAQAEKKYQSRESGDWIGPEDQSYEKLIEESRYED